MLKTLQVLEHEERDDQFAFELNTYKLNKNNAYYDNKVDCI